MWGVKTVENELQNKINSHKESYIGTFLTLVGRKKYGDEWENDKKIRELMLHLKYNYSEIYEALYDHCYEKVGKFLNEDGTGTEACEFWKELL